MPHNKRSSAQALLLCLLTIILAGCSAVANLRSSQDCEITYNLLSADRRCDNVTIKPGTEYEQFQHQLENMIEQEIKAGRIGHVSVYFRDLLNGPWFGINQEEKFSVASLLKVPVMMTILKQAEANPDILRQKLSFAGELDIGQQNLTDPNQTILPDETYTVEELLEKMIIYSDNQSKELLGAFITALSPEKDLVTDTLTTLGLGDNAVRHDDLMSVKSYASIFRILHTASYLNKDMSQRALDLLSRVAFGEGLVAGVPGSLNVAHKYGIREREGGEVQLHDCGIVYHPRAPYLLCIMTRGTNLDQNKAMIRQLSGDIYNEVNKRHQ